VRWRAAAATLYSSDLKWGEAVNTAKHYSLKYKKVSWPHTAKVIEGVGQLTH
jgi:hypothetical protein